MIKCIVLLTAWMAVITGVSFATFDIYFIGPHDMLADQAIARIMVEGGLAGLTFLMILDEHASAKKSALFFLIGSIFNYGIIHWLPHDWLNSIAMLRTSIHGILFMLLIVIMIKKDSYTRGASITFFASMLFGWSTFMMHIGFLYPGIGVSHDVRYELVNAVIDNRSIEGDYCNRETVYCFEYKKGLVPYMPDVEEELRVNESEISGVENWLQAVQGDPNASFVWTTEAAGRGKFRIFGAFKMGEGVGVVVSNEHDYKWVEDMQGNGNYFAQPLFSAVIIYGILLVWLIREERERKLKEDDVLTYVPEPHRAWFMIITLVIVVIGFRLFDILFKLI